MRSNSTPISDMRSTLSKRKARICSSPAGPARANQRCCSSSATLPAGKAVVVAPTGVAALNVRGQTIHSFFGFPPRLLSRLDIKKRRNRGLYKNMEVLVIDEISMVRADLLDQIDYFLRINRENHRPFGGLQVVFFGDLFQLPPVVASEVETALIQNNYDSPYFFSAKVFQDDFAMEMMELRKVYRQENRNFLRLLDAVRLNQVDYPELDELNERYMPDFLSEDFYITLSARNNRVDAINQMELEKILLPEKVYHATVKGEFNPSFYPTDVALRLKLNAQVMFVKNDPGKEYVNGTIGKVVKLEDEKATVMVEETHGERRYVDVSPVEWEIIRYKPGLEDPDQIETETIGAFQQLPLKLAWAITIHKSQGKTFDKVIIDLGTGAFEHGQTYVALSRCRTLGGIVLKQPIKPRDIRTDERIIDFYEQYFR
jgi:ATP-dependent DNA helicase PIF1